MPGPDPRERAMQELMKNPPPRAQSALDAVGGNLAQFGEGLSDLPIKGGYSSDGEFSVGALTPPLGEGELQLGGDASFGKDQALQRLAMEALKMGTSPIHVKAWLEMVKGVPARMGAQYEDDQVRAALTSQLPGADASGMSGSAGYKLPQMGGFSPELFGEFSRGPSQPNPLESQAHPLFQGAPETRAMGGIRGRF